MRSWCAAVFTLFADDGILARDEVRGAMKQLVKTLRRTAPALWSSVSSSEMDLNLDHAVAAMLGEELTSDVTESGVHVDAAAVVEMEPIDIDRFFDAALGLLRHLSLARRRIAFATFLETHFDACVGKELIEHTPSDWSSERGAAVILATKVKRELLASGHAADRAAVVSKWIHDLNRRWCSLCRSIAPAVRDAPERTSLLWLPEPFVIPGGRFSEIYYWDSWWAIKVRLTERRGGGGGGAFFFLLSSFFFLLCRFFFFSFFSPPSFLLVLSLSLSLSLSRPRAGTARVWDGRHGARNLGQHGAARSAVRLHTKRQPRLLLKPLSAAAFFRDGAHVPRAVNFNGVGVRRR